jgi:hypothetical protein
LINDIPISCLNELLKRSRQLREKFFGQAIQKSNIKGQRGGIALPDYKLQCAVLIRIGQEIFNGPGQIFDR